MRIKNPLDLYYKALDIDSSIPIVLKEDIS